MKISEYKGPMLLGKMCNFEFGGNEEGGRNRITTVLPVTTRLTKQFKQQIIETFNSVDGVEVKKVEKVKNTYDVEPHIRLYLNGADNLWT